MKSVSVSRCVKMIGLVIITLLLLFSAAGCLEPVSLEDCGYVISLGVDRGEYSKYYITLMLQRESSGEAGSDEGGAILLAAEGNDIFEAIDTMESNAPYVFNFSRTNFLIFGRQAAEDGMIEDLLGYSLDTLRIRASSLMLIADGDAYEFMGGMAANNEANVTKLQTAILLDRERTGMISVMSVSRMYEAFTEGRFDACTALGRYDDSIVTDMEQKNSENEGKDPLAEVKKGDRVGGLKAEIVGAALFDGGRMSGELDRQEIMYLNMAVGEFRSATIACLDPRGREVTVQLELKSSETRLVCLSRDGSAAFEIDVELYADAHQTDDSASAEETAEWLNGAFAESTEAGLKAVFDKCLQASSDAMRLGTELSKHFSTAEQWEAFDWKSRFPQARVTFCVSVLAVDRHSAEGKR